jgi:hypothetical protein
LDITISLGGWSEFEGDDLSSPFLLYTDGVYMPPDWQIYLYKTNT